MTELKTVVVLDGRIINIGDWDYKIVDDVEQNPMPDGAIIEQREMTYSAEKGWQLTNVAKPPSLEERLEQMEVMLINLLGVL